MNLAKEMLNVRLTGVLRHEGMIERAIDDCIDKIEKNKAEIRYFKYEISKIVEKIEKANNNLAFISNVKEHLEEFLDTLNDCKADIQEKIDKEIENGKYADRNSL
jgi:chromosome segregation ATPase